MLAVMLGAGAGAVVTLILVSVVVFVRSYRIVSRDTYDNGYAHYLRIRDGKKTDLMCCHIRNRWEELDRARKEAEERADQSQVALAVLSGDVEESKFRNHRLASELYATRAAMNRYRQRVTELEMMLAHPDQEGVAEAA